jgi:CheY-like chemotaxis protein
MVTSNTMTLPEHMQLCLSAPLPTSVWVGDELIVHTNDAFAAFLGAEQHAAVLGRPAREGFGTLWAVLQPLVERAPTVATDVRLVLPRAGDPTEVFATIALSRSEAGIVCTCIETTEHVRTRRRLVAHDQIVAVVTHDLRGQLGAAKTLLDVMRLSGTTQHVDDVEAPLRQAARMLDGLLEYSRISGGTLTLHRERVGIARILARAVELAGASATKIDTTEDLVVLADAERVASAVAHLLVHGETCELSAEVIGDRLRLTVRCSTWHATELAPCLARDFAPATGFGLALAFTRALVEHQGGTIIAHENSIVLEVPTETQVPVPPPREPVVRPRNRKRVLLVEDHDDAARSLKAALEMLGYEVAIAHDGPVALTVARAFRPDVALLDIGLPVMDGYELANRLRSINVATRELHVVAVTAYGTEEFRRRSRELGFAEHLVKPVDLARLERVVESLD